LNYNIAAKPKRRIKMRGISFVITSMIMVVILIGAIPATGQASENEQLRKYYNNYILKCISKNQSKAALQTSRSANLRSCGALSKQKVVFLTHNQNLLIDEMLKHKVGTKPYKVEHYLNKRFHETYH
jgi:hypothetical protein